MTYLEAAYQILSAEGRPLHYQEITGLALEQGLISPTGLTPDATMGSRLYTDTKQEGSLFVRTDRGVFDLAKRQPRGIDAQIREINATTRAQLGDLLHAMPPDRFETMIYELLIQMGFDESTLLVTPYHGDGGIDVAGVLRAAGLTDVNAAVQVKRWKRNVGAPTVTQLRGSLQVHQQGIIITISDFTNSARAEATASGKARISLINGDSLLDLLFKHKVGVQERTFTVMSIDEDWWGELLIPTAERVESEPVDIHTPVAPTGRKPKGFTLFDQSFEAHSWKSILIQVAALLAERRPADFREKVLAMRGRTRQYIASSGEGMTSPAPIPGADLWIETNFSAKDILAHVETLLSAFGYASDVFAVFYRE